MAYTTREELDKFDPQHAGRYDPGEIQVFFDNRTFGGFEDKMPTWQKYKLQALSRLGRADVWSVTDLPGGYLRIVFFTVRTTTRSAVPRCRLRPQSIREDLAIRLHPGT